MIQLDESKLQAIKAHIDSAHNILIVAHKNPDWDTIWATTAWYEALKNMGKNPTLVCESEMPDNMHFVPNIEHFKQDFNLFKHLNYFF